MTAYELMVKTNHHLIKGGALTDRQKDVVAERLLDARGSPDSINRFYKGVNYPKNAGDASRCMYPFFYIPPYDGGKKLKTVFGQTPNTHILSANMYELEILRLLVLFKPGDPAVADMAKRTLGRLKQTCYGNDRCGTGECFDASLVVLRFLTAAAPDDTAWILSRVDNYYNHAGEKKRTWHPMWYFWLCLSEAPLLIAEPEIMKYKEEMLLWQDAADGGSETARPNRAGGRTAGPVLIGAVRNCLRRL